MSQAPFLIQVAEQVLAAGFGDLTDAQKQQYAPTLASLIEERIGIELLPKLTDEQTAQFIALVKNQAAPSEQWHDFWAAAVPDFEAVAAGVVREFMAKADELRLTNGKFDAHHF